MVAARNPAARAFAALVRAHGFKVTLRLALPASVGDESEQLGLSSPGFEDRAIGYGVFRKAGRSRVLFVEAAAMDEAVIVDAVGVVAGTQLLRIETVEALQAESGVYGFAVTLQA
jgi:hypothetical protein